VGEFGRKVAVAVKRRGGGAGQECIRGGRRLGPLVFKESSSVNTSSRLGGGVRDDKVWVVNGAFVKVPRTCLLWSGKKSNILESEGGGDWVTSRVNFVRRFGGGSFQAT